MNQYPAFKYFILFVVFFFIISYLNLQKEIILYLIFGALILLAIVWKMKNFLSLYLILIFLASLVVYLNISSDKIVYPTKVIPYHDAVFTGKILNFNLLANNSLKITAIGDLDSKILKKMKNIKVLINLNKLENLRFKIRDGIKFYSKLKISTPKPKLISSDFNEIQYFQTNNFVFYGVANTDEFAFIDNAEPFQQLLSDTKKGIKIKICEIFGNRNFGVINALFLGDKSFIEKEVKLDFSKTGTAHLLALSGLHVGIISGIIYLLLGFVYNRWLKFLLFSIIISSFIIITGFQISAIRAGLMAISVIFGLCLERRIHPLNSLSFSSLLMVLFDNSLLYSAAFQMSVSSVLGIILFQDIIYKKLSSTCHFKNIIVDAFFISISVTLSASIIVSPIVAYYFDIFSIISPISNLIEIPLISLSLIGIVITLTFAYIYLPFAMLTAITTNQLIDLTMYINSLFADVNMAYISGSNTFFISLIISIIILLLIFAENYKHLLFRCMVITLSLFLLNKFVDTETGPKKIVIPAQNYVLMIDDTTKKDANKIYIFDRKPGIRPYLDKFLKYVIDNYKNPYIYYCGNFGLEMKDKLQSLGKPYKSKLVSPAMSDSISKYMGFKDNFFQIIDYNYENN